MAKCLVDSLQLGWPTMDTVLWAMYRRPTDVDCVLVRAHPAKISHVRGFAGSGLGRSGWCDYSVGGAWG